MKNTERSKFSSILCLLGILANTSTFAAVSGYTIENVKISDSLKIASAADTLILPKVYSTDFPQYSPEPDSLQNVVPATADDRSTPPENGLGATGSISRGIQVSSNASVSLQSSMYLKIKGNLSDHYVVSGVLSEKTSPLQPIGNTRRLNDFDRVMVKVTGPAMSAAIGDIDLKVHNGRFGKLERSIEGIDFSARSGLAAAHTSVGFSYGKYHLQQLQGKDGKQGPYRLIGKNGEKFIIVLAGSEKVKLNDKLLQRGLDDDYSIDYNAAEITFTQKQILSSNSRISVEFEYVPDIYLASYSFGKQLISGGFAMGSPENTPFYVSTEWQMLKDDSGNPLGNVDVDQLKSVFASLPDTARTQWVSSLSPDTINGDYQLGPDGVLVYAGENLGEYTVGFSFVGLQIGEYRKILDGQGSYFVHDTLNGEYLPAQRFYAPQSRSVFSVRGGAAVGILRFDLDLGLAQSVKNLYAAQFTSAARKARDIRLSAQWTGFKALAGDKYYEKGFATHDALESIEYYRGWQLSPRVLEEEQLQYGEVRIGQPENNFVAGKAAQLARAGVLIGRQMTFEAGSQKNRPLQIALNSSLTDRDNRLSQQHLFTSTLTLDQVSTDVQLSIEDQSNSSLYPSNDHLKAGGGITYAWTPDHKLNIHYDRRRDYRLDPEAGSFLTETHFKSWSDQRQDWSTAYSFSKFKNTDGAFQFKYREHVTQLGSTTQYYLGKLKFNGKTLNNRVRFEENYVIDEEHIPKYDYHYVEVDTGYGDYSYDPYIRDYLPISGGRFVRQRVFSDVEEQVRKYDNRSRLEYNSAAYGKSGKAGVSIRLRAESRSKLQVDTGAIIQDQSLKTMQVSFQTGGRQLLTKLNYTGRNTTNRSTLYNYGNESSNVLEHGLNGEIRWSQMSTSELGLTYTQRDREIEYNALATERWRSYRPYLEHKIKFSSRQKMKIMLKYAQVADLHLEQTYLEAYLALDHVLKIKRRGRLDQKLMLSKIKADVSGIPYSVFSGRQPGANWKYTANARYTFSSSFQLSTNYSIQKRGDTRAEQYLRLEGRTHF